MTWYPWEHKGLSADLAFSPHRPAKSALFYKPENVLRHLNVILDGATLIENASSNKIDYLLEMLKDEEVDLSVFSLNGPDPSAQEIFGTERQIRGKVDWIELESHGDSIDIVVGANEGPWKKRLYGDGAARIRDLVAAAASGRRNDPLAQAEAIHIVARAIGTDILITNEELSDFPEVDAWNNVTVLSPADAIPLIGLYLRSQGRYLCFNPSRIGQIRSEFQRKHYLDEYEFYRQVSEVLVPAATSLSDRKAQLSSPPKNLVDLEDAVLWRNGQALRARDRLFAILAVAPRDNTSGMKAAAELELILIWLMAAFDVTARIAHIGYGLSGSEFLASWQKDDWRKKLTAHHHGLYMLFIKGSVARATLDLIVNLRNEIHGSDPISRNVSTPVVGPNAMTPLVHISERGKNQFVKNLEIVGSRDEAGIVDLGMGDLLAINPGVFAEFVLRRSLILINASLEKDPSIQVKMSEENVDNHRSLLDQRLLWQLGFGAGDMPIHSAWES